MSSSGLIYAAILGAWAIYLASRCLRTPAHQTDALPPADGAVLRRRGRRDRYAVLDAESGEPESAHEVPVVPTPVVKNRRADLGPRGGRPPAVVAEAVAGRPVPPKPAVRVSRATARRRRRMVALLVLAVAAVSVVAGLALAPPWTIAVPVLLLCTYLAEVRAQSRRAQARLARIVQPVPLPVEALAVDPHRASWRILKADDVVDDAFADPWPPVFENRVAARKGDGWQPVPVPLPTYVTAPKAPDRAAPEPIELPERVAPFAGRRIDMSPGRPWVTSATEDTQELPILAPAPAVTETADEAGETPHKRAVNS